MKTQSTASEQACLLRVVEVADRLKCSTSTVYGLIESGRLGHHRCPGVRVSESQLQTYLESTRREDGVRTAKSSQPRPHLTFVAN